MKEQALKDYFDKKLTADMLVDDLKDSQTKTGHDVISVRVDKIAGSGEYEIRREHLIRLCEETISGRLTTTDLNTIAFALVFSDYFTWDRDEKTEDGKIVDTTIHDWDNPEIGYPLTMDNLLKWKVYLETGQYNFTRKDLKS
ncbi:MAG: hypothetical protein WDO15_19665 [Bacteroidota bacterium]